MQERIMAYRNYILSMLKDREEEEEDVSTDNRCSEIEELEGDCE